MTWSSLPRTGSSCGCPRPICERSVGPHRASGSSISRRATSSSASKGSFARRMGRTLLEHKRRRPGVMTRALRIQTRKTARRLTRDPARSNEPMDGSRGKPLIVQGDRTVFLEVEHPGFREARDRLMTFAELEKSPEYVHIYRITPLSLWNAAAAGISSDHILGFLAQQGKYPVPPGLKREIAEFMGRYGVLQLQKHE